MKKEKDTRSSNKRSMARASVRVRAVPCPDWCERTEAVGGGLQGRRSSDGSKH